MIELLKCDSCGRLYGTAFNGIFCPHLGCKGKLKLVIMRESNGKLRVVARGSK